MEFQTQHRIDDLVSGYTVYQVYLCPTVVRSCQSSHQQYLREETIIGAQNEINFLRSRHRHPWTSQLERLAKVLEDAVSQARRELNVSNRTIPQSLRAGKREHDIKRDDTPSRTETPKRHKNKVRLQEINRYQDEIQRLKSENAHLNIVISKIRTEKTFMELQKMKKENNDQYTSPNINSRLDMHVPSLEQMLVSINEGKRNLELAEQKLDLLQSAFSTLDVYCKKLREDLSVTQSMESYFLKEIFSEKEKAKEKERILNQEILQMKEIIERYSQEECSLRTELEETVSESNRIKKRLRLIKKENKFMSTKLHDQDKKVRRNLKLIQAHKRDKRSQKEEVATSIILREENAYLKTLLNMLQQENERISQEQSGKIHLMQTEKETSKNVLTDQTITLHKCVQTLLDDNKAQEEASVARKTVQKYKSKVSEMQNVIDSKEQEIALLKNEIEIHKISRGGDMQNTDGGNRDIKDHISENYKEQLRDAQQLLRHVQKELDETKSRLSRAMGDKLTDNNPNIADLSDKNRPTKISERYQELYDNQWTDAFQVVDGMFSNEELTICKLKDILRESMEFCREEASLQMKHIVEAFSKGNVPPTNIMKQFKDIRKSMAEMYGKELFTMYINHLEETKSRNADVAKLITVYFRECFELCWLMVVQDPPVEFGPDAQRSDPFNKEHYKHYTKSGDRVSFVVWPVLLLYKNGPALCKGVAQGC